MKTSIYTISVFLVLCTVYLFGFAYAGTYLYDRVFSSEDGTSKETKNVEEKEPELEDKLNSPEKMQVLAENEIGSVEATPELEDFFSSFSEIDIEPVSTFSILKFVEDQHISSLTNQELSLISTGLYEILLHSDMEIVQRHHGHTLPDFAELGYEARVDRELNQDFIFANPDSKSYKIRFQMTGDSLLFVLEGTLPYEVEISLQNKQTVKPRVIKQYTPYLDKGQTKTKTEGKAGVQIEVWKSMLDSTGAVLKEELISRDYYPPVHREELASLQDYTDSSNVARGTEGEAAAGSPVTSEGESGNSNHQEKDETVSDETDQDVQTDPQQASPDTEPSTDGEIHNPNMK
ncbi:VanW family protein [Bacillus sp. Marseille-Q1617]|uniref:VanW family protein n=1 Tax=Bacillus sp. Marseille-Q1617 TaxID=2736887 RepID=UPI00158EE92E|nr:VanW family protein [Bacillus sp. Marseille-Q1617]